MREARPAAAAPEAIDRMDEAFRWLCWLDPDVRELVWVRAEGLPWKRISPGLASAGQPRGSVDHGLLKSRSG